MRCQTALRPVARAGRASITLAQFPAGCVHHDRSSDLNFDHGKETADRSRGARPAGRRRLVERPSGRAFRCHGVRRPPGEAGGGSVQADDRPQQALPWKLRREHSQTGPATNLRNLSAAAQGRTVPKDKLNTALRWANRLVDGGLDIAYDPEHGFQEVPAEGSSHIGRVLAEVQATIGEPPGERPSGGNAPEQS